MSRRRKITEENRPGLKRLKGLRGSKFGAANEGRRLSAAERKAIEDKMRKEGRI